MLIGELGKTTGASPKAIRLYESLGLLGAVRRQGAYRVYSDAHVGQVRLIRQAQALGFKLADLAPFMQAGGAGTDWNGVLHFLELKRTQVRAEIARLQQVDAELGTVIEQIASCGEPAVYPFHQQCVQLRA